MRIINPRDCHLKALGRISWAAGVCVIIVLLSSCQFGPEYKRPELPQKDDWNDQSSPGLVAASVIHADWWTQFNDSYLDQLVEQAIASSFDLKILVARIEEAGALISLSKSDLLPSADLTGAIHHSWSGDDAGSTSTKQYDVRAGIGWDLDIWGRNRKRTLAVEAEFKAREADYRAGYLKLVSEVALAYFSIRQIDELVDITSKFLVDNRQILTIYQNQFAEGLIPGLRVSRQAAQLRGLEQELLELDRLRAIHENRIATLLGQPAGAFNVPRSPMMDALQPFDVPTGLPSDLLYRRPDILAAEYRIMEAYHQVGESQAARLPSFSLTGDGGLASSELSSLIDQWSLGLVPQLLQPIFDAGRRKAQVAINEALARVAEDEYRLTVMLAFEEVENALGNLSNRARQKTILEDKLRDLEDVRTSTHAQLELGLVSQLEVIDTEEEIIATHRSLLDTHRYLLDDTVILFKALGGGWPEKSVQAMISSGGMPLEVKLKN